MSNKVKLMFATLFCLSIILYEVTAMSGVKDTTELKWEWPAGRKAEEVVIVKIDDLKKAGKGLLGIKQSPSLMDSLPDPMDMTASLLYSSNAGRTKYFSLNLPQLELQNAAIGDRVALGLVGSNTCICIVKLEKSIEDSEYENWVKSFDQFCGVN